MRRQLAVGLLIGVVLLSGCTSFLPDNGGDSTAVGDSATMATEASEVMREASSLSYRASVKTVDESGETQWELVTTGESSTAGGDNEWKGTVSVDNPEVNVTDKSEIYRRGDEAYRKAVRSGVEPPADEDSEVIFGELPPESKDTVRQQWRQDSSKSVDELDNDTVISMFGSQRDWDAVDDSVDSDTVSPMMLHASLLDTLAAKNTSVEYNGETATISGNVSGNQAQKLVRSVVPVGDIATVQNTTSAVHLEYKIDTESNEVTSAEFRFYHSPQQSGATKTEVEGTVKFSGYNNSEVVAPDAVA